MGNKDVNTTKKYKGTPKAAPDGMNVMNIGEPFDASDRVYYIEGIKGNTGIWNNYHPKTSKETLVDFYTPLLYEGQTSGVITGYIEATTQLAPLFETTLYGEAIHGLLLDENNMVICSTIRGEYEKDLSLEMLMKRLGSTEEQIQELYKTIANASRNTVSYKDSDGVGRVCVTTIPGTQWKVAIIVPATSFKAIIKANTSDSVFTVLVISLILILYAAFVLLRNIRSRKEIAAENVKLEEKNRLASSEITEIRDIISSANMGIWRIELVDGVEPRMYVDDTMKELLGIAGQDHTPEKTYTDWFDNIKPEAVASVL